MHNLNSNNDKPKNLVILGGGESGVGAALLAKVKGVPVFLSDFGSIKDQFKQELIDNAIAFEEKQHTEARILKADLVVKSPGIPDNVPIVKKLVAKGIPVISEIEWAYRFHQRGTIIAITGSNGKTTTTSLIGHIFQTNGLDVAVGGNIGKSFARILAQDQHDFYVLELSSFQLDGIVDFCPDIAILLNITPDHLDRYDYKMEGYRNSKLKIAANQTASQHFIINADDKNILSGLAERPVKSRLQKISTSHFDKENTITLEDIAININVLTIKGRHNLFNAACAIYVSKIVGLNQQNMEKGLKSFTNVPHRMENIRIFEGVQYINDSKATNVDAVYYALQAMTKPIIWVAGGLDKGNEYSQIEELVIQKVKVLVCLGADNSILIETFSPHLKIIEETNTAQQAVAVAKSYAQAGDVVLLSPACSSFDLFNNYEARGDQFKEAVNAL